MYIVHYNWTCDGQFCVAPGSREVAPEEQENEDAPAPGPSSQEVGGHGGSNGFYLITLNKIRSVWKYTGRVDKIHEIYTAIWNINDF